MTMWLFTGAFFLSLVLLMLIVPDEAEAVKADVAMTKERVAHHRHLGTHQAKKQFKKDVARDPDVGKIEKGESE
jgi:hypothetical protein